MIEYRKEKRQLEKTISLFTKYKKEIEKVVGSEKYREEIRVFENRYYKITGCNYQKQIKNL